MILLSEVINGYQSSILNFECNFCDFRLVREFLKDDLRWKWGKHFIQDSPKESYHQILVFPVLSSEEKSDGPGEMAFLRAIGVKSFQATSRGSVGPIESWAFGCTSAGCQRLVTKWSKVRNWELEILFIEGGVKFLESLTCFSSR